MNAINPNHDDTFEVQPGSPVIGAKPANNGTSAQPNSNFIMYYSIAEIIEESKKRQLIADAQEEKFREFLETIAKARALSHSGFIKTQDIATDKVIGSAANLFSLTKEITAQADGSALLKTNDGHAIKIKNNQIAYAGAADPKSPKQFDKNAAMVMALAALEDPSMMPPNVIHIDNATKAQKRLIQETIAQINQERGLNLRVENPSRSLRETFGFGTKTRAATAAAPAAPSPKQEPGQADPVAEAVDSSAAPESPENDTTIETAKAARAAERETIRLLKESELNLSADKIELKPTNLKTEQGLAIFKTQLAEDTNTYFVIQKEVDLSNGQKGKYTLVQIKDASGKPLAVHPDMQKGHANKPEDKPEIEAPTVSAPAPQKPVSKIATFPTDLKTGGANPLTVHEIHIIQDGKFIPTKEYSVDIDGKMTPILWREKGVVKRDPVRYIETDLYHDLHPKNPIKAAQKIEAAINTPEGKKNIKENGTVVGKTNGRGHANVYSILHDGQKIEVANKGGQYRVLTIDGKTAELNQDIKINKTAAKFAAAAAPDAAGEKSSGPPLLTNPILPAEPVFKTTRGPVSDVFAGASAIAARPSRLHLSNPQPVVIEPGPAIEKPAGSLRRSFGSKIKSTVAVAVILVHSLTNRDPSPAA